LGIAFRKRADAVSAYCEEKLTPEICPDGATRRGELYLAVFVFFIND